MDFAGILAFISKKRRQMSSNKERRPSGYSLDGLLMRQWSKNSQWLISLNGIVITDIICIDRTFEKTECVPNESALNIDGGAMLESISDA